MKRIIGYSLMLIFVISAFSSCKKCYVCDFGHNDVRELCSKDFPDGTDGLKLTIDEYEKQGYKCTEQ